MISPPRRATQVAGISADPRLNTAVPNAVKWVSSLALVGLYLGDPLPSEPLALTLRLAAFALVISAAALTPAPVRAAGIEEEREARREPEPAPAVSG